jgi:hypothetical protein
MNKSYRDFIMEKITVSQKMLEIYPEHFSPTEPEILYDDLQFEDYYNNLKGIFDILFAIDISFDTIDTIMEQLHLIYVKVNNCQKKVDNFEEFVDSAMEIRIGVCKTVGYELPLELQTRFLKQWMGSSTFHDAYDKYKLEVAAIDAIKSHFDNLSDLDIEEFGDENY